MRRIVMLTLMAAALACGGTESGTVEVEKRVADGGLEAACVTTCRAAGYETGTWCDPGGAEPHLMVCYCHPEGAACP